MASADQGLFKDPRSCSNVESPIRWPYNLSSDSLSLHSLHLTQPGSIHIPDPHADSSEKDVSVRITALPPVDEKTPEGLGGRRPKSRSWSVVRTSQFIRQSLQLHLSTVKPESQLQQQYKQCGKSDNSLEETKSDRSNLSDADLETSTSAIKSGAWHRLWTEYRKNYCPRTLPPLVLPTPPTDTEKFSYVAMRRLFLTSCGTLALLALSVGSWQFTKAAPIFAWYSLYIVISQFYLFTSLFITMLGKEFDIGAHHELLRKYDLNLDGDSVPTVDVYLPVCKEPLEVLENTWQYIAALKYPNKKIKISVLDDGADNAVESLAMRFGFTYICRPNRPELKKAGNLRYAFAQTSGEYFTVFDADFCPRPDFLLDTIPYLIADDRRAILQTPQYFRSSGNQTWTEQGAGAVQEYIFRIMQSCRDKWGAAICVGSNAIYRRAALEPIGGTVPTASSEDVYTGFYALTHGWTVKSIPLVLACGMCPDTPRAYFSQQLRWCSSMDLIAQSDFWSRKISAKQRLCYLVGFMYYVTTALQTLLGPLPAPLILWSRPDLFQYYNLFFAFPNLLVGLVALRMWTRNRYTLSVQYVEIIMSYAYVQAMWNLLVGKKLNWTPSGGGRTKSNKNDQYRNMRILAWGWTIVQEGVLIAACVYRVLNGLAWYNLMPVVAVDLFHLLCMHRFLVYQHAKSD